MAEFFITFMFLLLMVGVMAVGVMRGREPISGTCGGLNQMGDGGGCELCGGNPAACRELAPMADIFLVICFGFFSNGAFTKSISRFSTYSYTI